MVSILDLSVEEFASLLANAHLTGYREGFTLCPTPDADATYLAYHEQVTDMCTEHVEH